MCAYCQRLNAPGVSFAPYSRNGFGGVKLGINPRCSADLTALDILMTAELNRLSGGKVIGRLRGDELNLFHKVYGGTALHSTLAKGGNPMGLIAGWQRSNASFRSSRQRYLLYP
jgi:hypothetical protein